MFYLENVELFLGDHPELSVHRVALLAKAKCHVPPGGHISGRAIDLIFSVIGDPAVTELFVQELTTERHVQLVASLMQADPEMMNEILDRR